MAPGAETTQEASGGLAEDIWGRIPPEERLEIMASAQAKGVQASLMLLLMGFSVAIGFKVPWILFGTILLMPFAFQIMSAKAWHLVKARPMLEYATARATSRLYAYHAGAHDLTPGLIFRAELEPVLQADEQDELSDELSEEPVAKPVWVSLYPDTMVIIAEGPQGARLELGHSLFQNFSITAEGFDELEESSAKKLSIEVESHPGAVSRWNLASRYPATLLACERRAKAYITRHQKQVEAAERRKLEEQQQKQARLEQQRAKTAQIAFERSGSSASAQP